MAKKTAKPEEIRTLTPELGGLACIFVAAFLFVSVFSFHPADPTFNQSVMAPKVNNLAGTVGAYAAGLFVELFGMGAVFWPLFFLYFGLSRFIRRIRMNFRQWSGLILLFVVLTAWMQHPWFAPGPDHVYDIISGGWLGRSLNALVVPYVRSWGSFLLWLFLTLAGAHLLVGFSWRDLGKAVSAAVVRAWSAWQEQRRRARAMRAFTQAEKQKKKKKNEPDFPEPPRVADDLILKPFTEEPEPKVVRANVAAVPKSPKTRSGRLSLPSPELLRAPDEKQDRESPQELAAQAKRLEACLGDFGVQGEIQKVVPGPVVTMFEFKPAPGVKISRIASLSDDIALALKARSVRIEAPIPGKDSVGVEIPNTKRQTVYIREMFESRAFLQSSSLLTLALGKDIHGRPTVADLARMPHLLVAGATGKGKSVFLNGVLLSLLYKADPERLKLLLVDPKRIELAVYADLPHLVHPVVTDMALAKNALEWAVQEMDRRYESMARIGVRNIESYNSRLVELGKDIPDEQSDLEPMPYLVIVIDELADLMLTAAKEVETSIVRLAQLARAAGIHLILATQRPSVDVVTGLIKANFPTRISFQVSARHDSRTILDTVGAERLLGLGDMLHKPSGSTLQRLHAAYVDDAEIAAVVAHWRGQCEQRFELDFCEWQAGGEGGGNGNGGDSDDPVYREAVDFVMSQGKASISLIQRRFRIGFNRAARFIEQMEQDGLLGPQEGSKPRNVIRPK
nr:DNA translocase FtsK [Paucidesulfovibrio longus]